MVVAILTRMVVILCKWATAMGLNIQGQRNMEAMVGNNQGYQYRSQYPGLTQHGNYGSHGYSNNQGYRSGRDHDDDHRYGGGYGQYRQHNDND